MNKKVLDFELSFEGSTSDEHIIDLYDVSEALKGFHRTLALTSHLVLNGEVIGKAPFVKNLEIYSHPSEEGSWKMLASLTIAGHFFVEGMTAPQNTNLGHIFYSAYDYVIKESLGFEVDYNKSLGKLYSESQGLKVPVITESQLHQVIDKTENSIIEMHRPIYKTNTANKLSISTSIDNKVVPVGKELNLQTYSYLTENIVEQNVFSITGIVSSYSTDTYKGRIYFEDTDRTISFMLDNSLRKKSQTIGRIVRSLKSRALKKDPVNITMDVQVVKSKTGKLKGYLVQKVWKVSLSK